jgi:predicted metalloprotease with PDZ domain
MTERMHIIALCLFAALALGFISACGSDSTGERGFSHDELSNLDTKFDFAVVSLTGEPRLQVNLSFVMPRERIGLRMPNQFLRKVRLFERIEMLETLGPGRIIDVDGEENKKILEAPVGSRVKIRYFVKGYGDKLEDKDAFSAPMVENDYFQFAGSMALIFPVALFNNREFPIKMEWHLSPGYNVYNSFGSGVKNQSLNINANTLIDGIFIGGSNIRSEQSLVRGKPVTIVLSGFWEKISDQEFTSLVTRLIEKQRETWNDDNFPYFLISIVALGSGCRTNQEAKFGGTAHVNSFRAYYPVDCPMKAEMKQLISHELMHMWIGKKIKVGEASGGYDGKWFTEGFTDFYGRIMAYRAGLFNEATYFKTFNSSLEKYYTSNERYIPLKHLVKRIYRKNYSNRELENIPYQQGEIMAADLNMRIQEYSNDVYSLDNVVKDLLKAADEAGGSKVFSIAEIEDVVDRYVPGAFGADYKKIEQGGELFPPKLPGCSAPMSFQNTSFQGGYSRHFPNSNILTYRRLQNRCARWLN